MRKLIKELCKREGKKSQVQIGNVREILSCLTKILSEKTPESLEMQAEFQAAIEKKSKKRVKKLK